MVVIRLLIVDALIIWYVHTYIVGAWRSTYDVDGFVERMNTQLRGIYVYI